MSSQPVLRDQECFRDLEWVREQLGYGERSESTLRRFLRQHGVPVIKGRVLQSHIFGIWERKAQELRDRDPSEIVSRELGL